MHPIQCRGCDEKSRSQVVTLTLEAIVVTRRDKSGVFVVEVPLVTEIENQPIRKFVVPCRVSLRPQCLFILLLGAPADR